jgi:hypothetical protein
MEVAPLGPNDLLTLGGAAVLVTILFKVIELATQMTASAKSRFGPLLSITIGVVLVEAASLSLAKDLFQGFITGILAGAVASGLYDVATSATSTREPDL